MSDVDDYRAEVRQLRRELAEARGANLHAVAEPEKSPPLRQADILRAFLQAMTDRAGAPEHATVKLARNAKGDTQIEVAGRGDSAAEAAAEAQATYDVLTAMYPMSAIERPDA